MSKYICSHNTTSKYAVFQETNETDMEAWLSFIRFDGNEENLTHLKKQLDSFETHIIENCSSIDIDLDHLVSAQTAKEMTKVELNSKWHRKFDGTLKRIDLNFKKKDDNEDKIVKTFEVLGLGQIADYISDEDIDDEDIDDNQENEDDNTEDENTEDENTEDENTEDENTEDENTEDENTEDENTEDENQEESGENENSDLEEKDEEIKGNLPSLLK